VDAENLWTTRLSCGVEPAELASVCIALTRVWGGVRSHLSVLIDASVEHAMVWSEISSVSEISSHLSVLLYMMLMSVQANDASVE
jgi:hypothetical protein